MGVKYINSKKYELVAPDGGWGYMIAVGFIINLITITAFLTSFGMIYKNLLIELGMDSTSVALLNGLGAFCVAISGMITPPLLKYLSIRQLGMIAAVLFNLGIFCIIFVKSKIGLFICFGILQSFGNATIFNLSCTVLNNYFVKRRLLAFSLTQTIVGIVGLFSPQFVKWALESYGFKGTILLLSAASLQSIIGMFLMQPVEWHMKKVDVPESKEKEMKSLLTLEEKQLSKDAMKMLNKSSDPENFIDTSKEKYNIENQEQQYRGIKKVINTFIDLSVLKSFLLSNACVGVALCLFSDYIFMMLLPQALYSMGWTEAEVAWALSLNAMGDLVTKGIFILLSKWLLNIGSHEIYVIGLVVAFITRLGILWSDNMTVMIVFITLMGIPHCTINMLIPVVIADAVDQEKFTLAVGIMLLLFGFFNIVIGPIIGAIRDLTDSYSTAFYILTSCFGIVIMFWTIELVYKKNKHKRVSKEGSVKA